MSERNTSPGQDVPEKAMAAYGNPANPGFGGPASSRKAVEQEGSLLSHLLYGLGTLLFVLPLFLPGVSMFWLTIAYGSLVGGLAIGLVFWALLNTLRNRRHRI
jgi:hypothetical protein